MEAGKICRLLIVIFLCLSVLFYALYRYELDRRTVISDELVASAVENLNSRGIEINSSIIERKMPERDIYYFEIGDKAHFDIVVNAVSNAVFGTGITMTEFDTPEGLSVGIYDKKSDDRELGRFVLYDRKLSFNFSKIGIDMSYGEKPILNMQTDNVSKDVYDCIDEISSALIGASQFGYTVTGSSSNDSILIVTAMQTVDGSIIKDVYLNYVFMDGELVLLSGNWITSDLKAKYHNTLTDGVNILYKLDLDNVTSVINERIVYSLGMTEDNRYFLLPRWEVVYTDKDGSVKTTYFDAL